MPAAPAFAPTSFRKLTLSSNPAHARCSRTNTKRNSNRTRIVRAAIDNPEANELQRKEMVRVKQMRSRLEGLFGASDVTAPSEKAALFNGEALRTAIRDRWGVEYDVQPQKRGERVYVQIMWRYFEQQSFYMCEDEFASHCEAVAQLLRQWEAVDYFCDFISSVKKRPVVGITINILIPGIKASTAQFEEEIS